MADSPLKTYHKAEGRGRKHTLPFQRATREKSPVSSKAGFHCRGDHLVEMHTFRCAISLRSFCCAARVPARVQKGQELQSTGRVWKCCSSKCTGQELGGAKGSCRSQQLQEQLWESAAEILLSPLTASSRRMVMQCYLLMHASV